MGVRRRVQGGRAARRAKADLESGAAGAGWSVDAVEVSVRDEEFPPHLRAHMLTPVARERRVVGEGFILDTWRCSRISAGRLGLSAARLHLFRVPAPVHELEIFFGRMPEAGRPIVMPELFRDRVALLPQAQVMAGGDLEKVLAELEPFLGDIAGPAWSLVVSEGEIALLSLEEADLACVNAQQQLVRGVEAALTA